MATKKCIIAGLGPSIIGFVHPEGWDVIGVNDIGRYLDPKYLVEINGRDAYSQERWDYIAATRAEKVFSHIKDLPIDDRTKLSHIKLGNRDGIDLHKEEVDFSLDSPFMACIIAYKLGYREIGLIGVDHIDHRMLRKRTEDIIMKYRELGNSLVDAGCAIWNFSSTSIVPWPYLRQT